MAGSADTSLLQPFPFSIVHAYSHYHCTSNWISSQAKPLSLSHSSSTPQQHRVQYCYSDFLARSSCRHDTRKSTFVPTQYHNPSFFNNNNNNNSIPHRLPIEHSLPSDTPPRHTHDRIPHRQPSLLPSQTGGVRSLKEHSFVPYTRQPVDLFCHHAERTVRRGNPALDSLPGLPPCAHDPDRISDYPTL